MKLWCAEGDVLTAANLNLYWKRSSSVVWHSDYEPLFGERGDAKVIVSTQALFKWKGKSCLDGNASSCYLGHGDILVMDVQCQDEFLHCTDPCLESGLMLRSVGSGSILLPALCGLGYYVVCQRVPRVCLLLSWRIGSLAFNSNNTPCWISCHATETSMHSANCTEAQRFHSSSWVWC